MRIVMCSLFSLATTALLGQNATDSNLVFWSSKKADSCRLWHKDEG